MGPFPRGTGSRRFLLAATDYFTKWVEAEPLQSIGESNVRGFLWKNIITRFGIPRALISDNGTQFKGKSIEEFCKEYGIVQHFSSVGYPQGNGQAEASNKIILHGLKKRLEEAKGNWVEELPSVLWAFRTTPRRSTGESPYLLTYGTEAVLPIEIGLPTMRTSLANTGGNDAALEEALDQSQGRREASLIKLASYQQALSKHRKGFMKTRDLQEGDLVLRKVMGTAVKSTEGKLGQNWEGPYKVTSATSTGAYYLEDMEGNRIPNPWNISNLRIYYH